MVPHGRIPESEDYFLTEEQIRTFHQDGKSLLLLPHAPVFYEPINYHL